MPKRTHHQSLESQIEAATASLKEWRREQLNILLAGIPIAKKPAKATPLQREFTGFVPLGRSPRGG
jgi:hypothetical protein